MSSGKKPILRIISGLVIEAHAAHPPTMKDDILLTRG